MVKVIEEKSVPKARVHCSNCDSLLEYGNADLLEGYHRDNANYNTLYAGRYYYFNCPVCRCKVSAGWIIK